MTTDELDAAAGAFIREHGGIPTSEGYKGYPKAICISPNDVVVHGIPDAFVVSDGDLVTIDVGVTLDGYIADSAYTFGVGEIEPEDRSGCSTSPRTRSPQGSPRPSSEIASGTSRTRCRPSSKAPASR